MSALTIHYPGIRYPVPTRPARKRHGAVVIPFPVRPARVPADRRDSARLRITRRGRLVLTLGTVALLAVVAVAFAPAALRVAGPSSAAPAATQEVTVLPGDTLWGIASVAAAPGEDVRDVIADIMRINGLDSSGVVVGQELAVPVTASVYGGD